MPRADQSRPSASLTVLDVQQLFGVSEGVVLSWIRTGELRAVNVSRSSRAKRPRWRISPDALAAFEAARTQTPAAPTVRRSRKQEGVIEFYK